MPKEADARWVANSPNDPPSGADAAALGCKADRRLHYWQPWLPLGDHLDWQDEQIDRSVRVRSHEGIVLEIET